MNWSASTPFGTTKTRSGGMPRSTMSSRIASAIVTTASAAAMARVSAAWRRRASSAVSAPSRLLQVVSKKERTS